MARRDYVGLAREIVYGSGLGEKPSIRRASAATNVSVVGAIVTFELRAGEGAHVDEGDVLVKISEDDASQAFAFYVLTVVQDTITTINGYRGSPKVTTSAELNDSVLEQNPLTLEHEIHESVDVVFQMMLWPNVAKITQPTVIPNLATGQVALPVGNGTILRAFQKISGITQRIPFFIEKGVHTDIAANNLLGNFKAVNGSTIYLVAKEKLAIGDEATLPGLVRLVATGAAALALGASVSETSLEPGNKSNQELSQRAQVGGILWRDFLTIRDSWSEEIGEDLQPEFVTVQ